MKLVPFATRVRMDIKAFPSRPSVPLLITNSQRRNSILFMTAMKYVRINRTENFSRSRWHSQIAFPTVLMFFLVTQVRNCEDESRILNDLHRITIMACLNSSIRAIKCTTERIIRSIKNDIGQVKRGGKEVGNLVLNYEKFQKKHLRGCPGRSLREYANFYLPWGIA
ncbi:hypothetical protein T03_17410 [Trichinella britovi]|uniref:Uncharacterized protein n=1 Tax=Trichinella britovi TaxID=45882 RepID=A0A0V1BLW2_TRIBR|nr:hypothetical protein T03_17410 [Trichinella britovi]